jgi:hypothetical protein
MGRILSDAIDRTNFYALWRVEVTNTFSTFLGIDDVKILALNKGAIRAFRLTHIAVDTFFSNAYFGAS